MIGGHYFAEPYFAGAPEYGGTPPEPPPPETRAGKINRLKIPNWQWNDVPQFEALPLVILPKRIIGLSAVKCPSSYMLSTGSIENIGKARLGAIPAVQKSSGTVLDEEREFMSVLSRIE